MTTPIRPQLSHCGIYARDAAKLAAFYTEVLGLVVSDRGPSPRMNAELVFLTGNPGHHHQLVIITGRAPEGVSTVNQLSFKVKDLDELKEMHRRVRARAAGDIRVVSHGNALSFYSTDPEGNGIEIYIDTPWYVPQPHGVPFDLAASNEEIMATAEKHCRASPGFLPEAEWKTKIAARLSAHPTQ